MSIISLVVLFLVCLSFHACNARQLGVIIDHKAYAERSRLPNKENKKSSLDRVLDLSSAQKSMSNKFETATKENLPKKSKVPHEEKKVEQAWFDLDYLPPRTHPPIHN